MVKHKSVIARDLDIYKKRLEGVKLKDIGNDKGISSERVRQIYRRMLRRDKNKMLMIRHAFEDIINKISIIDLKKERII